MRSDRDSNAGYKTETNVLSTYIFDVTHNALQLFLYIYFILFSITNQNEEWFFQGPLGSVTEIILRNKMATM